MPEELSATLAALGGQEQALARLRAQTDPEKDRHFVAALYQMAGDVARLREVTLARVREQGRCCQNFDCA